MAKFPPKYVSLGAFSVTITIKSPDKWNRWFAIEEHLLEKYAILFKDATAQSHKYLIRVTPFETGRLRAGWTSWLEKERIDYSAACADTSLIDHGVILNDSKAISEGASLSTFQEKDLFVSLHNGVPYAPHLEFGTARIAARHFTNKARYRAELIFQEAVAAWLNASTKAGQLIDPPKIPEATS